MPTFKNNTDKAIIYRGIIRPPDREKREVIIIIDAGKEIELNFWIPYDRLGLQLVNENYPPVPDTLLLSGVFKFDAGTERKFTIEPCDMYTVDVILQSGGLKIYTGSSPTGAEVRSDGEIPYSYRGKFDWEHAPYLRVTGLEDGTEAVIHAEVRRGR